MCKIVVFVNSDPLYLGPAATEEDLLKFAGEIETAILFELPEADVTVSLQAMLVGTHIHRVDASSEVVAEAVRSVVETAAIGRTLGMWGLA